MVQSIGAKPAGPLKGSSKGRRHISKAVVKVFRINYGFRALMDWTGVGKGTRALTHRGSSDLAGPIAFGKGGAPRPPEQQADTGPKGRKILGQEGFYYDVKGPDSQPLGDYASGGMGATKSYAGVDAAVDKLGSAPQQWIYLAAEAMYDKARPPGTSLTDAATMEEASPEGKFEGTTKGKAISEDMTKADMPVPRKVIEKSEVFQRLLKEVGTSTPDTWLGAFVSQGKKQGVARILELQTIFEKYFKRYRYSGPGLDEGEAIEVVEGPKTVEEFAGAGEKQGISVPVQTEVSADIIKNPSFRDYGNPLDFKFNDDIKLSRGPTFRRMDITSSFLINPNTGVGTGTHGTGKVEYNFDNIKNKKEAEKEIETAQWKLLDKKLNPIIDKFIEHVKTINRDLRKAGKEPIPIYKPGTGVIDLQRVRVHINEAAKPAAYALGATYAEISWALHHMANMISGAGESYANTMSILVNGVHSTLVLVYETSSTTGKYTKVHANIFEDETPLEWTIRVAQELGADGLLDEIAQSTNVGIAALGVANVTQFGVANQGAEWLAGAVHPRLFMGKLIEPQFGAVLNNKLSEVYKHMSTNVKLAVKDKIKKNAVTYSSQARKFAKGHNIHLWRDFAINYLTGSQTRMYKDVAGGDPFWFLWMAPYISTEIHEEGGAKQFAGGTVHGSASVASPKGMPSY